MSGLFEVVGEGSYDPDTDELNIRPVFRVEPCVLSNEILYQQEGGEPIVYAVMDQHDNVWHVSLTEEEASDWEPEEYEPEQWTQWEITMGLDN